MLTCFFIVISESAEPLNDLINQLEKKFDATYTDNLMLFKKKKNTTSDFLCELLGLQLLIGQKGAFPLVFPSFHRTKTLC